MKQYLEKIVSNLSNGGTIITNTILALVFSFIAGASIDSQRTIAVLVYIFLSVTFILYVVIGVKKLENERNLYREKLGIPVAKTPIITPNAVIFLGIIEVIILLMLAFFVVPSLIRLNDVFSGDLFSTTFIYSFMGVALLLISFLQIGYGIFLRNQQNLRGSLSDKQRKIGIIFSICTIATAVLLPALLVYLPVSRLSGYYKRTDLINWEKAVELIRGCQVTLVSQRHSRQVSLTLRDETRLNTTEPYLDMVLDEAELASKSCGYRIRMATE